MLCKAFDIEYLGSGGAAPRSHSSFADDMAPEDLIPKTQAERCMSKGV